MRRRRWVPARLAIVIALLVAATPADGAAPRVLNVLIDPAGLPALHHAQEDGPPVMRLPQLRLFDAEGRPLWSVIEMPSRRKEFRRELEARIESRQPIAEGRTLRQEARFFLRRGGLPLNLSRLPASELTVVEYWADGCGQCDDLKREIDRYFAKAQHSSVTIIRVFVDWS